MLLLCLTSASTYAASTETQHTIFLNAKLQKCLSLMDKKVVSHFNQRALELNDKIQLLCHSNKRNAAQNNAIGLAMDIHKSKDMSIFRQCRKINQSSAMVNDHATHRYHVSALRYTHICDK